MSRAPESASTETPWLAMVGAPGSTRSGGIVTGQLALVGNVTTFVVGTTK